jgi:hypothetical protein
MHNCGSTNTPSPSARIACVEHTSMHCVQPTFCERACAQTDALYAKYFGFSNEPVIATSSAAIFACASESTAGAK